MEENREARYDCGEFGHIVEDGANCVHCGMSVQQIMDEVVGASDRFSDDVF